MSLNVCFMMRPCVSGALQKQGAKVVSGLSHSVGRREAGSHCSSSAIKNRNSQGRCHKQVSPPEQALSAHDVSSAEITGNNDYRRSEEVKTSRLHTYKKHTHKASTLQR